MKAQTFVDIDGFVRFISMPEDGMRFPVRCYFCNGVYDLSTVEVTARYLDCSVWKAPCCKVTVDDRGESGWGRKCYTRIDQAGYEQPDDFTDGLWFE